MHKLHSITMISSLLIVSPLQAQDSAARQVSPCVAVPIFHCVQNLQSGGAIGHFGYDLQCTEDAGTTAEIFLDINDDNKFSTKSKDRGQPKIFLSGKHIDEFEVEFSAAEVKSGSDIYWSVLGRTAKVDFSKTKDVSLDCSILPK